MPKRKIPGAFTPRIIEALDWMSKDCSYKLAGNKMGIKANGINSLVRNAREIWGCIIYALFTASRSKMEIMLLK